MTEKKRFTYDNKTVSILKDEEFWLDGNIDTACNHSEICNELNKLADENEQLKQAYQKLKHRHSLLHDECLDIEFDRDSLKKDVESLEKENEQLKSENNMLKVTIGRNEAYIKRLTETSEWHC